MSVYFHYSVVGLHFFLCFLLIVVVLLQAGKGADIGAAFGGGSSNTVFGSRGPANFFHYLTYAAAGLFVATSLYLAIHPTADSATPSVFPEAAEVKADPAAEAPTGDTVPAVVPEAEGVATQAAPADSAPAATPQEPAKTN